MTRSTCNCNVMTDNTPTGNICNVSVLLLLLILSQACRLDKINDFAYQADKYLTISQ